MFFEKTEARFQKIGQALALARELARSAEGLTLDEMAEGLGISRRTAERFRDAVARAFGRLEERKDGRQVRFKLSGGDMLLDLKRPTASEMAELRAAANVLSQSGDTARAGLLSTLGDKIEIALRPDARRRLDTDASALGDATAFARRVGLRPIADNSVLPVLQSALLQGVQISFAYQSSREKPWRHETIIPYGLLFGQRYYLIGRPERYPEPGLYRLDRMRDLRLTGKPGFPPEDFDLQAFAGRSFGAFQEPMHDVVWRFAPEVAADARQFRFHAKQVFEDQPDGALIVRFQAGGLREMVWHLVTWGEWVEILQPEELKTEMRLMLQALNRRHGVCTPTAT